MFHIYLWVICIYNFWSSGTCRTINFLGCSTLYRIFPCRICTILTSFMTQKNFILVFCSSHSIKDCILMLKWMGVVAVVLQIEKLLSAMQEYREQPIFWTYTCKVVGHSKFQVNLRTLFFQIDIISHIHFHDFTHLIFSSFLVNLV